jgi:DNA polymerase-3 subunit epsilon
MSKKKTTALLIVDTETTGLDPKKHNLIEVAGVLYDMVEGAVVGCTSSLVHAPGNKLEHINRIPSDIVREKWALSRDHAEELLIDLLEAATETRDRVYLLAHNAAFDKQWLPVFEEEGWMWICSYQDAVWMRCPNGAGTLVNLALAYDVGVARAHRALEDCLTLAAVLTRVHELESGLDGWLARALESKVTVKAHVSYNERQLAKDHGFRWWPEKKWWIRQMPRTGLEVWANTLPFNVSLVPEKKDGAATAHA